MATSGTTSFAPAIAEFIVESFERLQIRGPALTAEHIISARRSANLIFSDWSADSGVNLWAVDQVCFGLVPGQITYTLPHDTVDLLDVYVRTYSASTTTTDLGNALIAIPTQLGEPIIAQPYGDVIVQQPRGGVLSSTAGSSVITMAWTAHGLSVNDPIFFGSSVTIGGLSFSGLVVVSEVVDSNTVQFMLPSPALESQLNAGGTALFYAQSGSGTVTCVLPGHSLSVGDDFEVEISTSVGGLTLSGTYTVAAVQHTYQFTFDSGSTASSTALAFENTGKLNVARQATGVQMTDTPLGSLSRNEYADIPVKAVAGRPSSFWVDRIVPPEISIYPVADTTASLGVIAYRMRELEDANPVNGEQPDIAKRFFVAFTAALTAALAEKWKPEMWANKLAAAQAAWDKAAERDQERVSTYITPNFSVYFR